MERVPTNINPTEIDVPDGWSICEITPWEEGALLLELCLKNGGKVQVTRERNKLILTPDEGNVPDRLASILNGLKDAQPHLQITIL